MFVDWTEHETSDRRQLRIVVSERVTVQPLDHHGVAVDIATLGRFHDEFMRAGLDLRFTSYGRGPRSYYPTIRQLYLETDLTGAQASFLAREEDYRFLRTLHQRGRVIPVVGDFGGTGAFQGIAGFLRQRRLRVSLFYTSNVEFYLFRQQTFRRYVDNVRALPWDDRGLIVRSYFGGVMGDLNARGAVIRETHVRGADHCPR